MPLSKVQLIALYTYYIPYSLKNKTTFITRRPRVLDEKFEKNWKIYFIKTWRENEFTHSKLFCIRVWILDFYLPYSLENKTTFITRRPRILDEKFEKNWKIYFIKSWQPCVQDENFKFQIWYKIVLFSRLYGILFQSKLTNS